MDIRTCRFCKKMFRGYAANCPQCVEELDQKYIIVRNYLDRNAGTTVQGIAAETGVDEKSILFLIREGRLMLKGSDSGITCAKCGKPVISGKFCEDCKSSLVRSLESTRSHIAQENAPKIKPKEQGPSRIHVLRDKED